MKAALRGSGRRKTAATSDLVDSVTLMMTLVWREPSYLLQLPFSSALQAVGAAGTKPQVHRAEPS